MESACGVVEVGQVAVAVLWILGRGALFDDDLDRVAFVLVQHVVDGAGRAGADAAAAALTAGLGDRGDEQHDDDQPDGGRHHSYRRASIGSSREALKAGYIPKKMPTAAEKPRPIANDHHGSEIGKPVARCAIQPIALPSRMPSTPPSEVRNAASIRN